ncbi:TIGR04338 family metallohydrolase [[Mycobacterium] kokjensenii]|uniref:TIGR04338 family metallohydrolase n=1 Tax=[Mycobacterium] kokjensenii TaxID=3064287 RepID=A0ABM9L657_9MYCO|nr:TIGR04338 family metallohydrolase [Mycolicibacter sp. MU0083]CAJ1493054.1 TIGR04338 family metallohydrolase [Mycolicibacter sp. MU0083]
MSGTGSERDGQRAKVYAAEAFVRTLFDRAASAGSRSVEFFGATLTLPPEARFGSVAAVQRYVEEVLALPSVADRWPGAGVPAVRARRGVTAAHYENRGAAGVIAVPEQPGVEWALRELVVLHEIAHHLSGARPAHGPEFVAAFCELAELVMGPELGYVLRVVFAKEGVR